MDVLGLLATVTQDCGRVGIHDLRLNLLEQQAESLGFLVEQIMLAKNASNIEYEKESLAVLRNYQNRSVISVVFGDIFLEDTKNSATIYSQESVCAAFILS